MGLISIFNAYGSGTRRVMAGLGPEKVLNPGFDGSGVWTFQTGASEPAGYLWWNSVAAGTNTGQDIGMVIGTLYRLEFTIVNIAFGLVRIHCGSNAPGIARSEVGTYIQNIVCKGDTVLYLKASINTSCNIDNVSVKEILYRDEDE